jgi:hypothetical protein
MNKRKVKKLKRQDAKNRDNGEGSSAAKTGRNCNC